MEKKIKEEACLFTYNCPLQKAMESIGGKWKLAIICSLNSYGSTRYNDLKRKMVGISNTMLAKALKELEGDGLVVRREYMEVPVRVEYESTELAKELQPILSQLSVWGSNL